MIFLHFKTLFVLPNVGNGYIISFSRELTKCCLINDTLYELVPSFPPKQKILPILTKHSLKNWGWTFPVVRYFTWILEFFSNILSVLVVYLSYGLLTEVVTFYTVNPRLKISALFKKCCLFDGESYFKNSSFIFKLFKILLISIYQIC